MEGLQILFTCSEGNEAILAPEDEIIYFRNLYNINHTRFRKPLSFGTEFIDANQIGLKFRGWIPHGIIERFKALYSMGLVSYMEAFKSKLYKERGSLNKFPDRAQRKFKPPNLGHSIIVIFVVLPMGQFPSLLAFTFEARLISTIFRSIRSKITRQCITVFLLTKCLEFDTNDLEEFLRQRP